MKLSGFKSNVILSYVRGALCAAVMLSALAHSSAATNDLASTLQRGLFEEEANHNYAAAIAAYEAVVSRFDDNRKLAATAIFRLGEVYRKQGKTNEATAQYQRVVREFADQSALVELSRGYVTAQGQTSAGIANNPDLTDTLLASESEEIKRIRAMIKESPDLINA